MSEDLLRAFADVHLIDKYNVYQYLMNYWADIMQDDVYVIATDGWQANSEMIPRPLVINRYFAAAQAAIEQLEAEKEAIASQMQEMEDEHCIDEGLLIDMLTDKNKIGKTNIEKRIRQIRKDADFADELEVLQAYLTLIEQESKIKENIKTAKAALDNNVAAKYATLNAAEIKQLIVDDKWMTTLFDLIETEMERISHALTQRIKELAERYATPLPKLTTEIQALTAKVEGHLAKMGFAWN